MQSIMIKKSIFSCALAAVWFAIGAWLIVGFFRIILEQFTGTSQVTTSNFVGGLLFTASVGSFFLFLSLSLFRQKYIVSVQGVEVRRLIKPRSFAWNEVKVFGEMPTFLVGNNYKVRLEDGTTATFFTSLMAHPDRAAKVLIEAAHSSGVDIEFTIFLGNEHGKPPYGIFNDAKADSR